MVLHYIEHEERLFLTARDHVVAWMGDGGQWHRMLSTGAVVPLLGNLRRLATSRRTWHNLAEWSMGSGVRGFA